MFTELKPFFQGIYFGDILIPATGREQIDTNQGLKQILRKKSLEKCTESL